VVAPATSLEATSLRVKGGLLSTASHEPLLALEPSPPGLDHGTLPGIPEAAGATGGPGPEDVEHLHELKGETGAGHTQPHHCRDVTEHPATSPQKDKLPGAPIMTTYIEDTFLRFV
jgi:hypothetical protein